MTTTTNIGSATANALAQIFPAGSVRYAVAAALSTRSLAIEALQVAVRTRMPGTTDHEVLFAARTMSHAGLVRLHSGRWSLTISGANYWARQTSAEASSSAGALPPTVNLVDTGNLRPTYRQEQLTSGGIVRLSSPADRLPMVYREGSLDAASLPRIVGNQRVWPDGRREPANTQPVRKGSDAH